MPEQDHRWTRAVAGQLTAILENAGYPAGDETHVFRALGLMHEAAHIYAGERAPGLPGRPKLTMAQYVSVQLARRWLSQWDVSAGGAGMLSILGGGPEPDRVARCARALAGVLADLASVLAVIDEVTGGPA